MDLINTPMSRVTCPNVENSEKQADPVWARQTLADHIPAGHVLAGHGSIMTDKTNERVTDI